jgi:hypothetical protein
VAVVDVKPSKLVEVFVDGTWYAGELRAWQKLDGRWRGNVTYTIGVGMRKLGWFDAGWLRPVARCRDAARSFYGDSGRRDESSPSSAVSGVGVAPTSAELPPSNSGKSNSAS